MPDTDSSGGSPSVAVPNLVKRSFTSSPMALAVAIVIAVGVYRLPEIIQALKPTAIVAPVVPGASIADTIEDERSRKQVAEYLAAWQHSMPHVDDLGHFYDARKVADQTLQQGGQLTGSLAAFDEALDKRLQKVVGLDPSTTDLAPLTNELGKVAEELRQ